MREQKKGTKEAAEPRRPEEFTSCSTDPLDRRALRTMMAAAAYQARRIGRTLKLTRTEREDAEQEILLVLLERRRFFDSRRGPWTPFVHRIARQAAQSLADCLMAERRLDVVAFNEPVEPALHEESLTLEETIEDHGVQTQCDILFTVSLVFFVGQLPPELRLVAEAALTADGDLADAQRTSGLSSSEFYRRLRELRYRLFTLCIVDRRSLLGS